MTTLRERVARAITDNNCFGVTQKAVDAAIAIVLEDAAKVAEGLPFKEHYRAWSFTYGDRSNDSDVTRHCDLLAAAIRSINKQD